MHPRFVRPLALLTLTGMMLVDAPPAEAATPDLDALATRLLANGDLMGSGRIYHRDGSLGWLLTVDETFDAAAVRALGGQVDWAYPERGIASVRSTDPAFGDDLVCDGLAESASPNLAWAGDETAWAPTPAAFVGTPDPDNHYANGPDLYAENAQWWFYAIDAAEPVASDTTVSGWTPAWKIEQDGTGITLGNNDEPGPAFWCDPLDVRLDVELPLWGVCALWGTTLEGDTCMFEDADPMPAVDLCDDLGTLLGNPTSVEDGGCRLADQPLADLYTLFYGYDYVNLDELSVFFRPRRLHPDFAWFTTAADASADPALGAAGGVLPFFGSMDDYRAFYEDRAMQALVPTGIAVVNEQLAFAGGTVVLTAPFAAALDDGTAGACSTADPRLPDPDTLEWRDYAYELFDPPFHRFGVAPSTGLNGYDSAGELRVILDENVAPIDPFGAAFHYHGTATASVMSARYQPDVVYGTLRGLAPGARLIPYPATYAFGLLHAFRRTADDGVLVLNNSWTAFDRHARWRKGNAALEELFTVAMEEAADDASKVSLLVFSAGNGGVDLNTTNADYGNKSIVASLPGALLVGGTAGRDYDWRGDIPSWMPDAPGRPYDARRRSLNLDRPMISAAAAVADGGTNFGSRVDLVAPSGSTYLESGCPEAAPDCSELYGDTFFFSWRFFEGEPGDPAGYYNVGVHAASIGTSFSAPLVAGAAALAAQAYEDEHGVLPTPEELARFLTRSADDRVGPTSDLTAQVDADAWLAEEPDPFTLETVVVDKRGPDVWMGNGRLNVSAAIDEARR